MIEADLRARLAPHLISPAQLAASHGTNTILSAADLSLLGPSDPDMARPLIAASVLIGIRPGEDGGILLTQRNDKLRHHAGQVSFPGGRIDDSDPDPIAAALREAQEEVGLDPASVDVLGMMPDFVTGTGFRVTPVVGLLRPGYTTSAAPDEVAAVFELPLSLLLDPAVPTREAKMVGGVMRVFYVWPHAQYYIWGATAAMLRQLAEFLR